MTLSFGVHVLGLAFDALESEMICSDQSDSLCLGGSTGGTSSWQSARFFSHGIKFGSIMLTCCLWQMTNAFVHLILIWFQHTHPVVTSKQVKFGTSLMSLVILMFSCRTCTWGIESIYYMAQNCWDVTSQLQFKERAIVSIASCTYMWAVTSVTPHKKAACHVCESQQSPISGSVSSGIKHVLNVCRKHSHGSCSPAPLLHEGQRLTDISKGSLATQSCSFAI